VYVATLSERMLHLCKYETARIVLGAKQDNPKVAVKVLHPNAAFHVHTDLQIMTLVANTIEYLMPDLTWLSLSEEVGMFGSMMHS
jgi:predicted unusual protein kinase regulating ubiquinone biosynthesis (AarF/ABC1/UbiB family)